MKTRYKYINFQTTMRDNVWLICNNKKRDHLGYVSFYKPRKRYCSNMFDGVVFDASCHRDIADFLDQLNEVKK